jgi:DNA polymerase III subunit epsilon
MSGRLDDLRKKLAGMFDIDTSDPSRGIQISLPKPMPTDEYVHDHDHVYVDGLRIENGKIIREARHGDSQYAKWAQAIGPALTELEKKPPAHRIKENGPPVRLDDLEYVVVDTETTGGSLHYGHRITEIAIVRMSARGKVLHEYSTLVNPGRTIPAMITALTHIDNSMVRMAPRFEDIAQDVRALLAGRVFVAHNASFDWGFVSGELVRTTRKPLNGKKLCTVRLARKVVPEIRRRSLDHLQYFFNVENEARHRAYGDARATAVIFRKMMQRVRDRDIETWQQLEGMTLRRSQKRKRTAMPHGMDDV